MRLLTLLTFVLCLFGGCKKDVEIGASNKSKIHAVIDRGNILDLAVNDKEVFFLNSNDELGIFQRRDSSFKFHNSLSSDLQNIAGVGQLPEGRLVVGEQTHGISYYVNGERKTFINKTFLDGFDFSADYCFMHRSTLTLGLDGLNQLNMFSAGFRGGLTQMTSMAAHDDTIWVGTLGYGLFHVDMRNQISKQLPEENIGQHKVKTVFFDEAHNLYVLTETRLAIRRNGIWKVTRSPQNVKNNSLSLVEGVPYIATDVGVYRLVDGVVIPFTELNNDLPYPVVNTLKSDDNGRLWVGTGLGLYVYDMTGL